ncbi:hypothetical protein P9112_010836 [Eukaryota sp. TZLM1-RC]
MPLPSHLLDIADEVTTLDLSNHNLNHQDLLKLPLLLNLTSLHLDHNTLETLKPLSKLPKLTALSARHCSLPTLQLSSALTIENLDVRDNCLVDLSEQDIPVSVRHIKIAGNSISSLHSYRILSSLPLLETLDVKLHAAPSSKSLSTSSRIERIFQTEEMEDDVGKIMDQFKQLELDIKEKMNDLTKKYEFIDDLSD